MSKSISKQSNRKKVRFPYTIVIPSTQQPDTLQTHTLSILHAYHIPPTSILIAVPSSEEEQSYKQKISPTLYGTIISIHASLPSADFFNRISDILPEGIPLIYMADNLLGIYEKEACVAHPLIPVKQLSTLFKRGFQECQKAHSQIWGIYPVANGHFMSHSVSTQLKYLPGYIWGCFNPGSATVHHRTNKFVDYERSILYWKTFGSIVRLNWISCIVSHIDSYPSSRSIKQFAKQYSDYIHVESSEEGQLHIRLQIPS